MSEELSKNFETLQLHAGYVCLGSDHGVLLVVEAIYTTAAIEQYNVEGFACELTEPLEPRSILPLALEVSQSTPQLYVLATLHRRSNT
jgi:hypothetical protein